MFLLVMLLSNATPTALNIQASKRGRFEEHQGVACTQGARALVPCVGLRTAADARLLSNNHQTPPSLQTMAVLFRHGEAEVSTLLFTQYLAAILTLPAWTSLFLRIIDAYSPT